MTSTMTFHSRFWISLTAALALTTAAYGETVDSRRIYVIDGDTIAIRGERERVRLLDIDAPEISKPRCERELKLGLKAKARLVELLRGERVTIQRVDSDRYGRALAKLYVNKKDVGKTMLQEGHAIIWQPGHIAWEARRQHWCGK